MTNPKQAPTAGSTPTPLIVEEYYDIGEAELYFRAVQYIGDRPLYRFRSFGNSESDREELEKIVAAVNAYTTPKSAGSSTPTAEQLDWARETYVNAKSFGYVPSGASVEYLARRLAEREGANEQTIADEERFSASDDKNNIQLHALRLARLFTAQQILGEKPMGGNSDHALSAISVALSTPAVEGK